MYKKIFLLGVCIAALCLNAYSQKKGSKELNLIKTPPQIKVIPGTEPKVQTNPLTFDLLKYLDLEDSNSAIEINDITFANVDSISTIINDYESKIYEEEAKYLVAKLKYKGLCSEKKDIQLKIKIIAKDGTLIAGRESPEGFSFVTNATVNPGNNYLRINGFGSNKNKPYAAGDYIYEVWLGNNKLHSKTFRIYPGKPQLYNSSYLKFNKVYFINVDNGGHILSDKNEPLISQKMRFLGKIVNYENLTKSTQKVPFTIRIFLPNGNMASNKNSPIGFSYETEIAVSPGTNETNFTTTWGNPNKSVFEKGTYIFEIWEKAKKVYETTFEIK